MRSVLIAALLGLSVLLFASACGGIQAARDAGEKVRDSSSPEDEPAGESQNNDAGAPGAGGESEEQAQASGKGSNASELVLEPKWYKDSDGNVVPDFIEADGGAGNDPLKDDCAPENCPAATEGIEFLTQPRNALLILDSSGSMAADDGSSAGRTKMQAAKDALSRYSAVSAALYETGFAVYGHTGNSTESGRRMSCAESSEVLAPIGSVEATSFQQTLSRFEPTGWTPIEGALREAEAAFAGKEGEVNRVVLVSDGIETCGGDPVAAARELQESGIGVRVDVVGFGVPDDETVQLQEIALAGGGEYFDAKTGADLDEYFRQQSEALGQTWDAYACQLRNSTFDSLCDQEQCQDATVFRIPDEQRGLSLDDPRYKALQDLSERINAGLAERQKAREEASARADQLYEQHQRLQQEYRRAFDAAYGQGR